MGGLKGSLKGIEGDVGDYGEIKGNVRDYRGIWRD